MLNELKCLILHKVRWDCYQHCHMIHSYNPYNPNQDSRMTALYYEAKHSSSSTKTLAWATFLQPKRYAVWASNWLHLEKYRSTSALFVSEKCTFWPLLTSWHLLWSTFPECDYICQDFELLIASGPIISTYLTNSTAVILDMSGMAWQYYLLLDSTTVHC